MNEQDVLMVLNAAPGVSNKNILKLLNFYGTAEGLFDKDANDIKKNGVVTATVVDKLFNFPREEFLKIERDLIQRYEVNTLTIQDDDYPESLREIEDAPAFLYVKGELPKGIDCSVAIVGSRQASVYGINSAERFGYQLAECQIPVVSGLARGIDAAAHRGALMARGKTIGVLGCGLSHIYPKENQKLYEEIPKNGAIISEFPMSMPPISYNFPRRNRIVSGLSKSVIVVEAAKRSGALITVDFALEQNRDVFAVPGKIDSPVASGVNDLIKQGAKMLTSIEDVVELLKPQLRDQIQFMKGADTKLVDKNSLNNLTEDEKIVYNQMTQNPIHIDQLLSQCSEKNVRLSQSILLKLEMKRLVKQLPGKLFVKNT